MCNFGSDSPRTRLGPKPDDGATGGSVHSPGVVRSARLGRLEKVRDDSADSSERQIAERTLFFGRAFYALNGSEPKAEMAKNLTNAKYYRLAIGVLKRNKIPADGGWKAIAPRLEELARIDPGEGSDRARAKAALRIMAARDGKPLKTAGNKKPKVKKQPHLERKKFYQTYQWRKLRLQILEKYGRRCLCCGATPEDGVRMHVDHIKPLKTHWELRWDPDNLQVLCEVCNHGKGNWLEKDYRPDV